MTKEFECENCNKKFTTLKRKINHYKICNYENLEKEITNLKFQNFLLKSINYNTEIVQNLLYDTYKNEMDVICGLIDDLENVNIDK